VYSVHHHGSATASNANWLAATTPKVAIISAGASNPYGHPTLDALTRLHHVGTKTYWTTPGTGAAPTPGADVVSNGAAIVVQAAPGATSFTVTSNDTTDTYNDWGVSSLTLGPPFGSFDTPTDGASVAGEVGVTGWALDDSGVLGIDIYRSPLAGEATQPNGLVFVGTATQVPGARPDVAGLYPNYPGKDSAGWGYMLLSNMLPNQGNGTFTIYAYVRTVDGANASIGSKKFIGANGTSKKPFGTIDTPTQGQTVSGTLVNFGWALTPQPNRIPVDGSTITVYIDNVPVGHPAYGQPRADIQSLFPGYANTNTAVGAFIIDTTTMTNGLHSIAWVVADNAGNSNGIGSRFFTVSNGTPLQPVGGVVPQGGVLHVNPQDPVLVTLPVASDGNLTDVIGGKDANGLPTGVTEIRRFAFSNVGAYDDVQFTPDLLPGNVLLRDGSRVNFTYGGGVVTVSVVLPTGSSAARSFLYMPVSTSHTPVVASLVASSNDTTGPLINLRVHVFTPPSNAVNDATVSGDFDAGRDASGDPIVGPFSAVRVSDGIYEGSLGFTPVSKPLLDQIVEQACDLTEKGVEDVCGAMDAVNKSWAEQAQQACDGLAAFPEIEARAAKD
jgi:hypothetical protein